MKKIQFQYECCSLPRSSSFVRCIFASIIPPPEQLNFTCTNKQYEKWLTEVKSNQPILENPEELTATILNRISGISPERKRRKFLIGAWASGIAASLLLLLFINDTCFTSVPHRTEMQNEYDNWSNSIPLPDNWEEMRLLEKNTYLSSQYTQHRKSRKMQILQVIKKKRLK